MWKSTGRSGHSTARQERLVTDRAKLLRDKNTIEAAGADGTCPLCRQKLGAHFSEIGKEFAAKLAAIQDEVVAVLAAAENLEKEKAVLDGIAPKLAGLRALAESQKVREGIEKETRRDCKGLAGKRESRSRSLLPDSPPSGSIPRQYATAEKAVADLEKMQVRFTELGPADCAGWRGAGAACGHTVPDSLRNTAAQKEAGAALAAHPFDPQQGNVLDAETRPGHHGPAGDRRRSRPGRRTPEACGGENCGDQERSGKGRRAAEEPDRRPGTKRSGS